MEYRKPEIFALPCALDSVQTSRKPDPNIVDSNSRTTAMAYEADE
jgi:hypothetical protein